MERHPLRLRTAAIAALLLGFAASMTAYAAGQGPAANGLTPGTDLRKATTEPGPATASAKALLAQVRRRQGAKAPASLGTRRAGAPVVGPDYVASANVSLVQRIPLPAGGVGTRVVGNLLYVTSTKNMDRTGSDTPALVLIPPDAQDSCCADVSKIILRRA